MDKWQKWTNIISSIMVPIVLALSGYFITNAIKEREIIAQYVKLAIDIIGEAPKGEDSELMKRRKEWAIEILKKYSPIPINRTFEAEATLRTDSYMKATSNVIPEKSRK